MEVVLNNYEKFDCEISSNFINRQFEIDYRLV